MEQSADLAKIQAMAGALVSVHDLCCVRGGKMLFRGLSFSLSAGELCHVQGANGIGKSSLIRIVAGLLQPFSGEVERSVAVALCDERLPLDMQLPLRRAMGQWARLDGAASGEVNDAIASVGLERLADIPPRLFSTGQCKRANLARLMISKSPLWLLDEPANGLDDAGCAMLGAAMERHLGSGGAIVAASHQPLPVAASQSLALAEFVP